MRVVASPEFAEQVGFDSEGRDAIPFEEIEDRWFGKPGTYRRYVHDRVMLKGHVKDAFVTFLVYPLRLLPWGHIAESFWYRVLTESKPTGLMDGLAWDFFDDAIVLGIRDALNGKRHKYPHHWFEETTQERFKPYRRPLKPPFWLITRIVIPQFVTIFKQHRENF